jgi:hypothetical protein
MHPEPCRNLIRPPRFVAVTATMVILNALLQGCARQEPTDRPQTESGSTPGAPVVARRRDDLSGSGQEIDARHDKKRAVESRAEVPATIPAGTGAGAVTREVAEAKALDEVVSRTKVSRDQLTADATRVDKFWYDGPNGAEPVLLSGWSVLVLLRPATPGGHYFLFVADDGEVKEFHGGA